MGNQKSEPASEISNIVQEYINNESPYLKSADPAIVPEEASLADLFPELEVTNLMPLDRIDCKHEHFHLHQDYIKNPLPAISVSLSKPVPVPTYSEIPHLESTKSTFFLPEYSRYVESTEDELAERVEYDMDEQDHEWFKAYNLKLKRLGEKEITYDLFEFVIDHMEKGWFDLVRDIPKSNFQDEALVSEDITCSVCDDGEAENSNAIVFCDGCNLAVHQDCYGVPFIPEGQWLCRKCMLSPEMPVSCLLCPNEGGAYKQTSSNKWAHLICALWIPECHISNTVFMEPIEGVESIQKSRWKLLCFICQKRYGAPIQCANRQCFTAFHVTCARKAKLYTKMRGQADSSQFKAFCDRHCPKDYRDNIDIDLSVKMASEALSKQSKSITNDDNRSESLKMTENARKKQNTLLSDKRSLRRLSVFSPILPMFVIQELMQHPTELLPKKRSDLLLTIAKYWSLKKESRRGAMLLKRLHIEPWTANASASKEDDEAKAHKYQILSMLRKDLERVRLILDIVRKRERQKLKYYKTLLSHLEYAACPLTPILAPILDKCKSIDKNEFFANPVDQELVPDYYFHIKNPMDFSKMRDFLAHYSYFTLEEFENHINLICDNCIFYNKRETLFAKAAIKLKAYFQAILPSIYELLEKIQLKGGKWDEKSNTFKKLCSIFSDL